MSDSIFEFSRDLADILAQTNTNAYAHTYFIHKLAYVLQLCIFVRARKRSEIDEEKEIGRERELEK